MKRKPISLTRFESRCRCVGRLLFVSALLSSASFVNVFGQSPVTNSKEAAGAQTAEAQQVAAIERQLSAVTTALDSTRQTLETYRDEVKRLQEELAALKSTGEAGIVGQPMPIAPAAGSPDGIPAEETGMLAALRALHDEQVAQQAEIKQLDQTKVEVSSKYPLRVSGLVLFNAFANAGVVDNAEVPASALYRFPGLSHGSQGATLRQTRLGVAARGPQFAGAATTAEVSVDFFGGADLNSSGYSAAAGTIRMRQAKVSLNWERGSIAAGYTEPLISPLSPTSFATVAEPSLAGSGNLWTWSPQISFERRIPLSVNQSLGLEAGLIYPASPGYSSVQLVGPIEASRRPAFEGRLSFRAATSSGEATNQLALGVSGYSSEQYYSQSNRIHSWAVAGDWTLPIAMRLELSGEIYRGRAIGGLGGGAYKDIIKGLDTATGLTITAAVEAVGGWSQLKFRFTPGLEVNGIFGMDDALARSFEGLTIDPSASPTTSYARNSSIVGNLIYRPRTYLIVSPEYRRIQSRRYTGPANIANIFTLSAGFQF